MNKERRNFKYFDEKLSDENLNSFLPVEVVIRGRHIRSARPDDCHKCVVANALNEVLDEVLGLRASVGTTVISITGCEIPLQDLPVTREISEIISVFDETGRVPKSQRSFTLSMPKAYLNPEAIRRAEKLQADFDFMMAL